VGIQLYGGLKSRDGGFKEQRWRLKSRGGGLKSRRAEFQK
jgi:hypothetical protein